MPAIGLKLITWQLEVEAGVFAGEDARKFVERLIDDLHQAGVVIKGATGFFDQMPETTASPVVLAVDMGGVPNHTAAPEMLVQFRVRARTWDEARDKAAEVFNFYHTETDKAITGYRIISALGQGLPTHMGEDGRQRHIVGFNMVFRAHSTNQGSSTVGYGGKRDPNEA